MKKSAPRAVSSLDRVPPIERDALAVLALLHVPSTRTKLLEALVRAGFRSSPTRQLDGTTLLGWLERWEELGWVATNPDRSAPAYVVRTGFIQTVFEEVASRGRLGPLRDSALERAGRGYAEYSDTAMPIRIPAIRVHLTMKRPDLAHAEFEALAKVMGRSFTRGELVFEVLGIEPSTPWFEAFDPDDRVAYLMRTLEFLVELLAPVPKRLHMCLEPYRTSPPIEARLAMIGVLVGGEAAALAAVRSRSDLDALSVLVVEATFAGRYLDAVEHATRALATMTRRKYRFLPGIAGVCHLIALYGCRSERSSAASEIATLVGAVFAAKAPDAHRIVPFEVMSFVTAAGPEVPFIPHELVMHLYPTDWVAALARGWVVAALGMKPAAKSLAEELDRWGDRAIQAGGDSLAAEFRAIARAMREGKEAPRSGLLRAYLERPAWETALDRLATIAAASESSAPEAAADVPTIVWELGFGSSPGAVSISPRLRLKGSKSTKTIAVATLLHSPPVTLGDVDRRVLELALPAGYGRGSGYTIPAEALPVLIGHPHLTRTGNVPVALVRGELTLAAEEAPDGVRLRLVPPVSLESGIGHHDDGPGRVVVYEARGPALELARALGAHMPAIPAEGVERLSALLGRLMPIVPVQSAIEVAVDADDVPADSTPVLRIHREGEALRFESGVAPLGIDGPLLRVGAGTPVVLGKSDGRPVRARRDLAAEGAALAALDHACPTFASLPIDRDDRIADDAATGYEVLLELSEVGDRVILVYAGGHAIAPPRRVGWKDATVRVRSAESYLDVDATLSVDEDRVLSLRELLESRRSSFGRFVRLGDGSVLALAEDLRSRLALLDGIGSPERDGIRADAAVAPLLAELVAGAADAVLDAGARARRDRFERAIASRPKLPRGLTVDLREYQRDGFEFLARLADAGLGACLADDMGLGKTVQALALLAHRAKQGPAVVVAPTSVVAGWFDAAARFAPKLRMHAFLGDRASLVGSLDAGDVLVCSYGTLGALVELVDDVGFATLVFDEAHLLKNARTQRARAARSLKADARIALTGTPIENHLGELHSLFHAILPGLLGSETDFGKRFAGPIAAGDREAANVLRRLVRPFVLRRTKREVLAELPARTESTRLVEPGDEERAFYEAVRRDAVARLGAAAAEPTAQARVRILAEILRLRQASLDPRLVDPDCGLVGSKIAALEELLGEALDEGHRVLVFSQFLGALALVREALVRNGVSFQELDGSTTPVERARRIEAFQRGEGEVFLMSLKAGGIGVNLTAADYVVHLDPWWNPAVEDQASDRAHRMGQTKPVTIYRLVGRGTIEEKILALHARKRALADDLLAGLDSVAPIDLETLRGLVTEA